jgi:signal transduction histidine kinase
MDALRLVRSYRLRMAIGSRIRERGGDAVVIASLAAGELEVLLPHGVGSRPVLSGLLVAAALPLLWRRRFPLAAPLTALAVLACSPLLVGQALVAGWVLGRRNERARALVGLAAAYVVFLVAVAGANHVGLGDVVYGSLQLLVPWLGGQAVRGREAQLHELGERATRLEREREQRRRAAVADERLRIARELHDVVAHSISVMTVQAGGARLLVESEPARAEEALLRVEETGRVALAEMCRLPGMLGRNGRDDAGGPRPGLTSLASLLEQVRCAGLQVELIVSGSEHPLPAGLDLAAFRVVQEALTNTLKHAGPATARVRLRYAPEALELEVEDDGSGTGAGGGGGHGLVGMRERVAIYGGELRTGRRPGGGYGVRVRLPLGRAGR